MIKSIQLEGVRKIGTPQEFALKYYEAGVDEIIYMDAVASLYDRGSLFDIVRDTAENVFVPITVGGGIRKLGDVRKMLRAGADKIAVNTAATSNPSFISEIAETFGSQCVVLQIDAKRNKSGSWEAYCDGGRQHTGLDVIEWAVNGQKLGAGEILLTSVDREGTRTGFDIDLVKDVSCAVSIPVVASGGMGCLADFVDVVQQGRADAVAMAYVIHFGKLSLQDVRRVADDNGIPVSRH